MDLSPRTAPPPLTERLPGWWSALGMIAMYFLLQLVIGGLLGLLIGFASGIAGHDGTTMDLRTRLHAVMVQPDISALLVIVTLPLTALVTLVLVRRCWPTQWARPQPPGLGMALPVVPMYYAVAVGIGLLLPPLGGVLTQLLAHGHPVTQDVAQLGRGATSALRIPLLLVVVGIGPLVEELLFRGVLLSALMRRLPTGLAVAACALLFAAVHLPGLGFKWYALPDLVLLAALLCWLRLRSGSLWPAVLAHAVNNLFAMLVVFLAAMHHAM